MVGIPASMSVHKLDVRQGDRNSIPYYNGVIEGGLSAALAAAIVTGRVMSLNSAGRLVPGILAAVGANGGETPFYAVSGMDSNNYPDTDRSTYKGMPGYAGRPNVAWMAGNAFHGIPINTVLVGGFATIQHNMAGELSSTEMDISTGAPALYVPGALLTAVSATPTATHEAWAGQLRPMELASDVVVGIVAPAAYFTAPDSYKHLAFNPRFTPGTTVPNTRKADD